MLRNKFNAESIFSRFPPVVSWVATGIVAAAPISLALMFGNPPPESKDPVEDIQNTIEVHIEEFMSQERSDDIPSDSLSKAPDTSKPSEILEL